MLRYTLLYQEMFSDYYIFVAHHNNVARFIHVIQHHSFPHHLQKKGKYLKQVFITQDYLRKTDQISSKVIGYLFIFIFRK